MTETHTYDPLQKPLTIQVKDNNHQLLMDRSYQYDKAENITKRSSEEGTTQYTYDLLDRLTTAIPSQSLQQKGLPIESYSYDAIANRTGSAHQPGDWQYNDKNQLTQWGNGNQQKTLTYTPNGHIATEKQANKTLSYNYNAADRLTSIENGTTQIASYQYDPFGRRISKTVNGTTTYYLYTTEGLLAELDQQGNLQVAYGWQSDTEFGTTPLWQANLTTGATLKTAQYNYLHTDHLGTVQLATDSTGQVTWKGNSEAFGKTILNPTNKITMNLRFPGQYYDQETGTHYNYFRDYNPNLGRYNESDPIGLRGGWNTFGYVKGNPIHFIDIFGLEQVCILVVRGSITGFGTHSALYGSGSSNGAWLFDPSGGYVRKVTKNQNGFMDIMTDQDKGDLGWSWSLENFYQYHMDNDGDYTEKTCVFVTKEGADHLKNMAEEVGGGAGLICASNVSEVLEKSGMFQGFDSTFFPGNLEFPASYGSETQIIKPKKVKK